MWPVLEQQDSVEVHVNLRVDAGYDGRRGQLEQTDGKRGHSKRHQIIPETRCLFDLHVVEHCQGQDQATAYDGTAVVL